MCFLKKGASTLRFRVSYSLLSRRTCAQEILITYRTHGPCWVECDIVGQYLTSKVETDGPSSWSAGLGLEPPRKRTSRCGWMRVLLERFSWGDESPAWMWHHPMDWTPWLNKNKNKNKVGSKLSTNICPFYLSVSSHLLTVDPATPQACHHGKSCSHHHALMECTLKRWEKHQPSLL